MKKLTKAQKQLLTGIYNLYEAEGCTIVVVGDDKKTKIKDKGLMAVLSSITEAGHKKFTEDTLDLAKKLGIKLEVKTIVKLT